MTRPLAKLKPHTVQFVPSFPTLHKSDIINQTLSSGNKDEPFGHRENSISDKRGISKHEHASVAMHTLSRPEVMSL